jgi:uncharacterized ferritin-like protein (DUF455 family)
MPVESLFATAESCIAAAQPEEKADLTAAAASAWRAGSLGLQAEVPVRPIGMPGRPVRPRLVPAREVPARGMGSVEGRAALVHAIAHIELNAVDLAWDAVYRFRDLPRAYYDDWVRVAAEEAVHFGLLRQHLGRLGYEYGDFEAHNGLWEMARRTADDPLARMALVPRVLEARGLDVTPGLRERLREHGDARAAAILTTILQDEVGHVAAGSRWFRFLCDLRGVAAAPTFRSLVARHFPTGLRGPFNRPARLAAGFTEEELATLGTGETDGRPPMPAPEAP